MWVCNKCEKAFKNKAGLSQHQRVHQVRSVYFQCESCSVVFVKETALKKHRYAPIPKKTNTSFSPKEPSLQARVDRCTGRTWMTTKKVDQSQTSTNQTDDTPIPSRWAKSLCAEGSVRGETTKKALPAIIVAPGQYPPLLFEEDTAPKVQLSFEDYLAEALFTS